MQAPLLKIQHDETKRIMIICVSFQDSFCVAEDEVFRDSDETSDEFSILEILERKLKNKKRKRVDRNELPQKRRRRIIEPTNTSTEDEIE